MFSITFSPRFADLDSYGHVNNAVYATYFEMIRTDWLRHERWIDALNDGGTIGFVIAHLEIDFLSPILFNDHVIGELNVGRIGNKSWDFNYRLRNAEKDKLYATGMTTQVLIDRKKGIPIPIPETIHNSLEKYMVPTPPNNP